MVKNALQEYATAIETKRIMPVVFRSAAQKFKEEYEQSRKKGDHKSESQKKMQEAFKGELPESFYCPITGDIFVDPVMTCDGQTY